MLSSCTYVNTLISIHTFSFFFNEIPRKYILYPRALCLITYSGLLLQQTVFPKIYVRLVVAPQVSRFDQFLFHCIY